MHRQQRQQQQQQQLQRHVCNMLPITVKLLILIAVTTSLLLEHAGVEATATAYIPPPARRLPKPAAITTTRATPTGFQTVADLQAIGATALAAAVAAENHLLNAGRSSSSSSHSSRSIIADDVIIAAQSANLLLEEMQHPGQVVNLTRYYDGDIFRTNGVTNCNADTCVGLSSGTAGLVHVGGTKNDRSVGTGVGTVGHLAGRTGGKRGKPAVDSSIGNSCDCRCLPYLRTYREDLGICVDDIHECSLSPFVSGSSAEKIPYVFLPLRGQIIYPSREISFPDIHTPVCAVTGAQYLTSNGWTDLRNPIDTDYPFRMFRDEGRSFLQWLGEADLRQKMQGRLIVVHLVCRDMSLALNATKIKDQLKPPKNVFSPCVAFRVNGSPVKHFHNVSEVLFQSEATSTLAATSDGMSTKEYVVIGVCSLLLGLIYVSSVFLYLHMKKRKTSEQSHLRSSLDDLANEINYPKNDQVTFGAPFTRSGSTYSAASLTTLNEPRSRSSISSAVSVHMKEEMGIIKNNPLLQHFPQLNDVNHHHHHHSGFTSDISNSNSECETDGGGGGFHDKLKQSLFKQLQTAALVHPPSGSNGGGGGNGGNGGGNNGANGASTGQSSSPGSSPSRKGSESPAERPTSPTQESECLPEENVSIVEDMMSEEKIEQMRQMVNGTIRRKLFFNPAYFEPHLLAQPPPAAIEFLTKIREVIAIAKYKMATKRYQPSLIMIPEEGPLSSTTPSLYSSQLHMSGTDGCRGCATNRCTGHAKNCGDKRNSIEKWLQTVTQTDGDKSNNGQSNNGQSTNGQTNHSAQCNHSNGEEQMERNRQQQQESTSREEQQQDNECRHSPTEQRTNRSSPQQKKISQPRQRPPPPPPKPASSGSSKLSSSPPKAHIIEIRHSEPVDYANNACSDKLSTTITVNNRSFDAYTALSTAAHIYGFAEMGGEIYNNPKFILHDSPMGSMRSHCSSHRSKTSRKRLDVLDQYAAASTPTSLTSADREHYEMLRNMKQLPDLPFDTLPRDYNSTLTSNGSYHFDIPTPDYDSTMEKKIKDIYSNNTMPSSAPSVPTPDYSTLSKKSLRQCQPDSPIYRRKSPQYLIVDYETDSLERMNVTKRKSSQSSSSPSSDVSSQLSPSLSTALPLEEEVEISHAVYDKVNGLRKDNNTKKNLISKAEKKANKLKEMQARIKYDTPFLGSMTIEVAHEPPSDLEMSTDSEQFDPDTLDRPQKRHSFCDVNAWSEHLKKAQHFVNSSADCLNDDEPVTYQSLGNMNALTSTNKPLQSGQSFSNGQKSRTVSNSTPIYMHNIVNECSHMRAVERSETRRSSFDSVREIYQTQIMRRNSQSSQGSKQSCCSQNPDKSHDQCCNEKGRILTLEAKHSRRQRIIEAPRVEPPEIETEVVDNKTTIKIKTPNINRLHPMPKPPRNNNNYKEQSKVHECEDDDVFSNSERNNQSKGFYDLAKNLANWGANSSSQAAANNRDKSYDEGTLFTAVKKRSPPTPPPPPPPSSTSTTMNSHRSNKSSHRRSRHSHNHNHNHHHEHGASESRHYQNQIVDSSNQPSPTCTEETAEETASNHSESTEITGVSDTLANSEFDCSCNNTLNSVELKSDTATEPEVQSTKGDDNNKLAKSSPRSSPQLEQPNEDKLNSPTAIKKQFAVADKLGDSSDILSAAYNGLRNDYSLNKYLNRRKSQDNQPEDSNAKNLSDDKELKPETNNNNAKLTDSDLNKVDVISISSRSNRSSSRLSDRTKEMYRNAGVPVGIAYPQRSSANNSSSSSTTNVQTVYRCEIEPVQLTHGMQIAMGLKDRAKKAKDLKNAWKKFVSMAASKFSPTASPAPPFEKKNTASFLESLERDEGISSLIDEHPQVSTPKSSYSAPASQNYYEQRFGSARLQELDSGYMSADSSEVYKRSFYDRYNFRMMTGKNRIIRVDTIADHSDDSSASTERHIGSSGGGGGLCRKSSLEDSNRFEDLEDMGDVPPPQLRQLDLDEDGSDAESEKTLTRGNGRQVTRRQRGPQHLYSSEDEQGHSPSYGSSETDGETNVEDMWESGAESIETHSVLYKKVRKN